MAARLALLAAMAIAITAGCSHRHADNPPDVTTLATADWHGHVGRRVSMEGTFSLRGRTGPFIMAGGRPVYLLSSDPHAFAKRHLLMEGRRIRVTGVLNFARQPPDRPDKLPAGRPADHFYFDADSAAVGLTQR